MKKIVKDATINSIITKDLVSFKSSKNTLTKSDVMKIMKDLNRQMIKILI